MSKQSRIEEILKDKGEISNIDTIMGKHGVRTSRLGAVIHNLRSKYKIDTRVLKYQSGEYKDCIYVLRGTL